MQQPANGAEMSAHEPQISRLILLRPTRLLGNLITSCPVVRPSSDPFPSSPYFFIPLSVSPLQFAVCLFLCCSAFLHLTLRGRLSSGSFAINSLSIGSSFTRALEALSVVASLSLSLSLSFSLSLYLYLYLIFSVSVSALRVYVSLSVCHCIVSAACVSVSDSSSLCPSVNLPLFRLSVYSCLYTLCSIRLL